MVLSVWVGVTLVYIYICVTNNKASWSTQDIKHPFPIGRLKGDVARSYSNIPGFPPSPDVPEQNQNC